MIVSSPDPATDPFFARTLLALQHASYALEAGLVGDDRLPPLQEDERALAAWRGRWLTAWDGVTLLGAAAWSVHDDHVDVAKVMVSPDALRRGVASTLLGRVLASAGDRPVVVSTARANTPALSLYAKHGFEHDLDEHVPPGLWVARLRRPGRAAG